MKLLILLNLFAGIIKLNDHNYTAVDHSWVLTELKQGETIHKYQNVSFRPLILNNDGTISLPGLRNQKFEVIGDQIISKLSITITMVSNKGEYLTLKKIDKLSPINRKVTGNITFKKNTLNVVESITNEPLDKDYFFDNLFSGDLVITDNTINNLMFSYNNGSISKYINLNNLNLNSAGIFQENFEFNDNPTSGIVTKGNDFYTIRFLTGPFKNFQIQFTTQENPKKEIFFYPADKYSRT